MKVRNIATAVALGVLAAMATTTFAASEKKSVQSIEQAVAGDWRKPEAKARDGERHPVDALAFWGLKPKMAILELQPGGGWWTEILAPYAKANKGDFTQRPPTLRTRASRKARAKAARISKPGSPTPRFTER